MTTTPVPPAPEPDEKDWTWVLARPCPDCGYEASVIGREQIPALLRTHVAGLTAALGRPDAAERPSPQVWSSLEYACHVRDVCTIFLERLQLMLDEDDPQFANWDQDATALTERYWQQDPSAVAAGLTAAADRLADAFATVQDTQWQRPGRRSNGSVFTVATLATYFLHDVAHHAWDVSSARGPATRR